MHLIFIITSYFDLLLLVVEGTLTEIMKINFLCKRLNTTGFYMNIMNSTKHRFSSYISVDIELTVLLL